MAFLCAFDHAQRFLDSLRLKSDRLSLSGEGSLPLVNYDPSEDLNMFTCPPVMNFLQSVSDTIISNLLYDTFSDKCPLPKNYQAN